MFTKSLPHHQKQGFVLVDAIVAMAIAGILSYVFLASVHSAIKSSAVARDQFYVNLAVLELYEIAIGRAKTATGYQSLAALPTDTPHYFERTGSGWTIQSGVEVMSLNGFERSFQVSPVLRSSGPDSSIVTSGGVVDVNTLSLTISVSVERRGDVRVETLTTYIHNLNLVP